MDTQKGPLSGFRVLELGNLIAAQSGNFVWSQNLILPIIERD